MENQKSFKRSIARKLFAQDVKNASYLKRPGWEPSVIITPFGEIARVHMMGTVVYKTNNTLMFDDGTGSVTVRYFEESKVFDIVELGNLIRVIGRPREWNEEKYIVPEMTTIIENKEWFTLHQKQVLWFQKHNKKALPVEPASRVSPAAQSTNSESDDVGPYQKILNTIAMLDGGDGVDVDEVVNSLKFENTEKLVTNLIEEGEIFEVTPGKVMLLG